MINSGMNDEQSNRNAIKDTSYITYVAIALHIFSLFGIALSDSLVLLEFIIVWFVGAFLSSIELASRYKDDPTSVLASRPGLLYLSINGLISFFALYCINVFGWHAEVDDSLSSLAQISLDIIYAALGGMFLMRSSFIKLGHDSQIDLGLNLLLKKLLDMIDREVDRVRASKRSKDVTTILRGVTYADVKEKVVNFSLSVMQNISIDERRDFRIELNEIESRDDSLDTKKYSIGLLIYDLVGQDVLKSAVSDLGCLTASNVDNSEAESISDEEENFSLYKQAIQDILENDIK